MTTTITASTAKCLRSFNEVIELIRSLDQKEKDLLVAAWEDELGRLRIWTANVGVDRLNQAPLDWRLRDASHIRDQIISLLENLLARLDDARDIVAEDNESKQDDFTDEDNNNEGSLTDLNELQLTIASIIKSLFLMSILVREPAQHDSRRALLSRSEGVFFEPDDYAHVRRQYPKADEAIISRLSSATTRRRIYLRYQASKALEHRHGIASVLADNKADSTIASDTSTILAREGNMGLDEEESDSEEFDQWKEYEFLIPLPKEFYTKHPFECPICCYVIKLDNTRWNSKPWKSHVFEDLRPYMCLRVECSTPWKFYATRDEWLRHLETLHPRVQQEDNACQLCRMECYDEDELNRHNARHLEDLALYSLPQSLLRLEGNLKSEQSSLASSINSRSTSFSSIEPIPINRISSDGLETGPISSASYGGEADMTVATEEGGASNSHHSLIEPRASEKAKDAGKLVEKVTDKEDRGESKKVDRIGWRLPGWWYCCRDRSLNNPSLCEGRCLTCGHVRCTSCRIVGTK